MTYNLNYSFWVATARDLKDVIIKQHAIKTLKPISRLQVHDVLAEVYARYVVIVNKLGYLYDQTMQVQKRALIKRLLEASTKRLLELRGELKKLELSEFLYIDKTLAQRKLIPQDIQLMRPFYFPYIRSEEIDNIIKGPRIEEPVPEEETGKDTTRGSIKSGQGSEEEIQVKKKKGKKKFVFQRPPSVHLTPEQQAFKNAVTLIQSHERARQSRVWLTNINTNPDKFAPKMPEIKLKMAYKFMHKPTGPMLVPVKRTRFEANYFLDIKKDKEFAYYTKPSRAKRLAAEESKKSAMTIHMATRPSICVDFFEPRSKSFHLLSEADSIHAEKYFLEGMVQATCEVELQRDISAGSVQEPASTPSALQRIREFNAASIIQRVWKGFKAKQVARKRSLQRSILYNMSDNRKWKTDINKDLKEYHRQRRLRKAWFDQMFLQVSEDERARILKMRSPWIMEDITDQIRAWFREFYDDVRAFHDYPPDFKGGTILLVKGETMTVTEFKAKRLEKKKSKEDKKKEAEKKKKELEKLKAKALKEKKLKERKLLQMKKLSGVAFDFEWMVDNANVREMEKAMLQYEVEWEHIDERNNVKEDPYLHWISLDNYVEVYQELRLAADELMRIEYELLQQALAKDTKKKYKPKKQKKPKAKGKGKKKKEKDLTGNRTIASLYYEMLDCGLIQKYEKQDFDQLIGDYNYAAYEIRNFAEMDTPPSLGEVKDILREYIIGMGPLNLPKPRSICLAGPFNCGKTLILEILATETDSVIIDLSPEIVIKFADRMPYLIHLVTKMSKILQPTIITIKGVHRVFWKKIPKDQNYLNPRLIEKYLVKRIIKPIKNEDKILFVGLTEAPFQAKPTMKKCFERVLLLPNTDYGTSFLLWRTVALSHLGVPRDFDFSALAKVTKSYTSGQIYNCITETLNVKRRQKLSRQPLTHMEFLEYFLNRPEPILPPEDTEYEKFLSWFNKLDKLAKARAIFLKERELIREKEKKDKEKKKKK